MHLIAAQMLATFSSGFDISSPFHCNESEAEG